MQNNIHEKVEKQYYVYIFKSLENEKRRYHYHKSRRSAKEEGVENWDEYGETILYKEEAYEFSGHLKGVYGTLGIKNLHLFEALMQLSEEYREIIVLAYFWGLTDAGIGCVVNRARSTVAYQRNKAIALIKDYMVARQSDCDE